MIPADDTSLTENGSAGTDVSAASLTEETDPAVRALAAQNAAGSLRGVYPQDFWSFLTAFGDNILAGKYQNADDSTLLSALQELQSDCAFYLPAGKDVLLSKSRPRGRIELRIQDLGHGTEAFPCLQRHPSTGNPKRNQKEIRKS